MPEEDTTANRHRKRPERQLYVPPAQRQKNNTKRKEKKTEKRAKTTQILSIKWECTKSNYIKLVSICDFVNFLHSYHFTPLTSYFIDNTSDDIVDELDNLTKIIMKNKLKFVQLIQTYRNYNYFVNRDMYDYDLFKFDTFNEQTDHYLLNSYNLYDKSEFLRLMKQFDEYKNIFHICHYLKYKTNRIHIDDIVVQMNQAHFFLIKSPKTNTGYYHECKEYHNVYKCYENFKLELQENVKAASSVLTTVPTSNSAPPGKVDEKRKVGDGKERRKLRENLTKSINKRTRRVIKFVGSDEEDTNKDNLLLDVKVDDWEELYSSDTENDVHYEASNDVRREVEVRKWVEESDIKPSTSADSDYSHVVEVYDFPPTFRTQDIMQIFSHMNCESMYIKWINDTHALLVFGTPSQAKRAAEYENPLLKVRLISEASHTALNIIRKSDLKPAMKRPQTSLQTARRLITTHLGTRSGISPEQNQKEREILRTARERKRQARQTSKDAWEGNFDSKK